MDGISRPLNVISERLGKSQFFKDPITDDGTKKSAKGLLAVYERMDERKLWLKDQCSWKEEKEGVLRTMFKDGKLVVRTTLDEIRNRLK